MCDGQPAPPSKCAAAQARKILEGGNTEYAQGSLRTCRQQHGGTNHHSKNRGSCNTRQHAIPTGMKPLHINQVLCGTEYTDRQITSSRDPLWSNTASITLIDEKGRKVQSEKVLEMRFQNGKPVAAGSQWCNGTVGKPQR
jgi:hypothetical protein